MRKRSFTLPLIFQNDIITKIIIYGLYLNLEKCLFVINESCGNFDKFNKNNFETVLGGQYSIEFTDIDDDIVSRVQNEQFKAVAILGGDGTLNSVLNKINNLDVKILYLPYGTLNEKSHILKKTDHSREIMVGSIGEYVFTYVAAAGTFTPIGYTTKIEHKKKLKSFAYFLQVLKEYRVYNIKANIKVDEQEFDGAYTLIMVLKSSRCFKFHFNHLYDSTKNTGHILLIKSPGKNNLWNKIKIFFPFFRAFFIGFRKEIEKKNIIFKEFSKVELKFDENTIFDVDGEKKELSGNNILTVKKLPHDFLVYDIHNVKTMNKNKN